MINLQPWRMMKAKMEMLILAFFFVRIQTSTSFILKNNVKQLKRNAIIINNIADEVTNHVYHYANTNINTNHNRNTHTKLYSVTKSQTVILDGSSFNALELFLAAEGNKASSSSNTNVGTKRHGYCSVVTVRLPTKERVVGIRVENDANNTPTQNDDTNSNLETVWIEDGVELYKDSMATIPDSISDEDAISTTIGSLTGIHCAAYNPIPLDNKVVKNIGGSAENFVSSEEKESIVVDNKKAVVIGGGDFASFVADGLGVIGAEVTQVSTNKMLRTRKVDNVSISPPSIGELELGFASALGHFHVVVDTLSDETKSGESVCMGIDDDYSQGNDMECSSAVVNQLKRQHGCNRYLSTMCNAQRMVRDNGLIFGRNDAVNYTKDIGKNPSQKKARHILPPKDFGTKTLQRLLDSKVLYKANNKEPFWVQGWSMKDYWELTTWPRDISGADVRFGFPSVDDISDKDFVERKLVNISPTVKKVEDESESENKKDIGEDNPYIFNINGIEDLNSEILGEEKKCILFLSSTSCRTCKYLKPQYTKLSKDFYDQDVVFAQVNAFTKKGKQLSKVLGVESVPAFVLFRDGQRYGTTLSVTRIPSKKLNLALELLCSGKEWDIKRISMLK